MRYYSRVAHLMLEHLAGRPVSLVPAPEGITGELFFQKHLEKAGMPGVTQLDPALHPDHPPYLVISTTEGILSTAEGILSAAQMNVIEFRTWNATKNAIGKPDRMTFDLDPGEGLEWSHMQEAAQLVRIFLNELGLKSFLKTSGGKGWQSSFHSKGCVLGYGKGLLPGYRRAPGQDDTATICREERTEQS